MLKVHYEDKIAWKGCYEKFFNKEFVCDKNSLSAANTVSGSHLLIDKVMVRKSISTLGLPGLVQGMIKSAEEGRVDMVTELINRILLQSYCY